MNDQGQSSRLLGYSPVEDGAGLSSGAYVMYLRGFPKLRQKSQEIRVCIIRDDCNANKCTTDLSDAPFVSLTNPELMFEAHNILKDYEHIFFSSKVKLLIIKDSLLGANF